MSMIPAEIQIVMFEVRNQEKNTLDFKNSVTAYLIDTYDLNEVQAAIVFNHAEGEANTMEGIFYSTKKYGKFAKSILRSR